MHLFSLWEGERERERERGGGVGKRERERELSVGERERDGWSWPLNTRGSQHIVKTPAIIQVMGTATVDDNFKEVTLLLFSQVSKVSRGGHAISTWWWILST